LGLGIYRKLANFLTRYEPEEYWQKRGKRYQKEFTYTQNFQNQEKKLIDFLQSLSFCTVLEFGCGFGRITKLMLENFQIKKYDAFDLSSHQINNAKQLCRDYKNVSFTLSTIQDLKINEKFDLVLGVECLMHVLPNDINQIMNKLASFANHDMINLDRYEINPKNQGPTDFSHAYTEIYENIDGVIGVKRHPISDKQSIFHAQMTS